MLFIHIFVIYRDSFPFDTAMQHLVDSYDPQSIDVAPWVTAEFRQLIKRRQRAFLLGQHSLYKKTPQ